MPWNSLSLFKTVILVITWNALLEGIRDEIYTVIVSNVN